MATVTPPLADQRQLDAHGPALRGPVVLATDGRDESPSAAAAARRIARRLGVEIEVVAALPPLQVYAAGWDIPVLPVELDAGRREELQAAVVGELEPVLGSRAHWRLDIRHGPPGTAIAEAARDKRASLIVLGTGAHRRIDRLLGDEIPVQVMRRSGVPVLAVQHGEEGPFTRAVVGIDFSAASIRAAMTALALIDPGTADEALLTLVHVRPPLDDPPPALATWTAEYETHVAVMLERVGQLLRPHVPAGVTLETRTRQGIVMDVLREAAEETSADILAVGTHSANWVDRLIIGSVATSVLRHSAISVLVAPTPNAAERVRLELRVAGHVALDRPEDWGGALDTFSRRNAGRRARLEVSGHGLSGFAIESEGYPFRGAAYDAHPRRVDIMLGEERQGAAHLTHAISDVQALSIVADGERRDRTLIVEERRGEAVVTFLD